MVTSGAAVMPHRIKMTNHRPGGIEEACRFLFIGRTLGADEIAVLSISFAIPADARPRGKGAEKGHMVDQRPT
jgi:hypothetical protein